MNDASGEDVNEHVRNLEGELEELQGDINNDQAQLDPSRWFFASSLFPMIAGTLGPVASAFSICALVRPWRQHYPPGSDIEKATFIDDPSWLLSINAVQLVIAVAANFSLLMNMTKRIRFTVAQPVTIIGWYTSTVLLIILEAVAAKYLGVEPAEEHVWSQAYYYGIYAAVLYFIVASLMVVTFWGAYTGHYDKDFQLTPSQRTLMLQTISFLLYLLIGALVFSKIEHWDYLDAVYWADVTLFTVGFGDIYPETTLGRGLLIPYALIGIISLGLVIGSIRSLLLDRGKWRIDARIIEKKRQRVVKRMTKTGHDDILEPIPERPSTGESTHPHANTGLNELKRREKEFNLMRKIQRKSARKRRWLAMSTSTGVWAVLWLVGAVIFQRCEEPYQNWTYFDGVYLGFVSLTTIGYGDMTPVSNPGKSFFVFWSLLALPTMTVLISDAGDTVVKGIRDLTDQIATLTILPGEDGFAKNLKRTLIYLSSGRLFTEDIEELPPGFLGQGQPSGIHVDSEGEDDAGTLFAATSREKDQRELDAEKGGTRKADRERKEKREAQGDERNEESNEARDGAEQNAAGPDDTPGPSETSSGSTPTRPKPSPTMRRPGQSSTEPTKAEQANISLLKRIDSMAGVNLLSEISADKQEYHIILIEEISRVMRHLKNQPPRQYTFAEWAWYLKLIGEDEASAETHRKAQPHLHVKKADREDRDTKEEENHDKDGQREQWSWVGSRNPLMSSQEEAEWILEKLTEKLVDELKSGRKASKGTVRNDTSSAKDEGLDTEGEEKG